MIEKIILKNFKRFHQQEFDLSGAIILAGPNNSGKTTLIQAIATWYFAWNKWYVEKGSSQAKRRTGAVITRQILSTMPLRELNLLWKDTSTVLKRAEGKPGTPRVMSITLKGKRNDTLGELTMEFRYSNSEIVYAKPSEASMASIDKKGPEWQKWPGAIVHIPSFSGISSEEPIHAREYQDWLIGQGKPGDILRNLLVEVYKKEENWKRLKSEIRDIFGYSLLPPQHEGRPFILCDYLPGILSGGGYGGLPKLDIASAGSGFLQTLMLLAFFYARPASILLMDEPDAHLHVILQGQVYDRLRQLAGESDSQLIVATHSEVLINATEPSKIISFYGMPHILVKDTERDAVRKAIKRLSSTDIALAEGKRILYVEDESDFRILRSWAKALKHRASEWFTSEDAYCHYMRGSWPGIARSHFFALRALELEMKGLILLDGNGKDDRDNSPSSLHEVKIEGLKVHTWKRYEIENYLVHPTAIRRFFDRESIRNPILGEIVIENMKKILPPAVMERPLDDHDYLNKTAASKELFPTFLKETGRGIEKADYYQIAEGMQTDEIGKDIEDFFDLFVEIMAI